jgi:hypothetical protein
VNKELRVLFMSGYAGEDLESRARLSHFAMLEKPFTAALVLRATHDILASRSQA